MRIILECQNSNIGKTDTWGNDCMFYDHHPNDCGNYDDDDFAAYSMCCACKGKYFLSKYFMK